MEDRCTPLLYMELGEGSDEASGLRANELAALPNVHRVTWWANCVLGRTDLPMRIQDGSTLVVVEAD